MAAKTAGKTPASSEQENPEATENADASVRDATPEEIAASLMPPTEEADGDGSDEPRTVITHKRDADSSVKLPDRGELHTYTLNNGVRVTVLDGTGYRNVFELNQLHPTAVDSHGEPALLAFTTQTVNTWTDVATTLEHLEATNNDNNDNEVD